MATTVVAEYAGKVSSAGAATDLPSGWSSARDAAGAYTVTHSLDSLNYVYVATSLDDATVAACTGSETALNTFSVQMWDLQESAPADVGFQFVLMTYST